MNPESPNEGGVTKIYDDWNPVYDEPEWPNEGAGSGDY